MARRAGLIVPLFSAWSSDSWGIGELPDLAPLSAWMQSAGFDRLMLLPLSTMVEGQASPYSAASAFAIDPIYIALDAMEDFARAGGVRALSALGQQALADARLSGRVRHRDVRLVKREALQRAATRFISEEWESLSLRASAFAGYLSRERWWLDDYALFQALAETMPGKSWREWPSGLRDRDPRALTDARRDLAEDVLTHQYWQWIAEAQWQAARRQAAAREVMVLGDLTFVVETESADVWARPGDFMLDVSAGAPPDAFSAQGQDWGLPTYRWDVVAASDFAWLRQRARRMAALYGGFRVDHLIGFYRTYGKPLTGPSFFTPADEPSQIVQGERVLRAFMASGTQVVAEDLGVIPDFVRASLARLGVPGCRVLRWERRWHDEGQPFIDPTEFPAASLAMTGTHDTETVAGWWERASADERAKVMALPRLQGLQSAGARPDDNWNTRLRDAILDTAYGAGSDDVFMPIQDLFGWSDRINTPATVGSGNWTWRLPWAVDALAGVPEVEERAAWCRAAAARHGRLAHDSRSASID
jgi:4-alpha-glucanotransferase